MISIPAEFDRETEEIYWQSIREIIRDKRILDAYDKLHLIKLKNFIEDQIRHRKGYVHYYLVGLKDLEVFSLWEIDLKKRIEKMISKRSLFWKRYSTFIDETEIKLFQKDIDFVLASAHQYGSNFKVLEALKLTLNTVLNKEKRSATESEIVLHENNEKLSITQIIFLIFITGLKKGLEDPTSNPESKFHEIAKNYDHNSPNSAYKIFDFWNKNKDNKSQFLRINNTEKFIRDIKNVLLTFYKKELDNDIIVSLNNHIKKNTEGTYSDEKPKEPDNKIDPKYLNKDDKEFTSFQISWYLWFEKIKIYRPTNDDRLKKALKGISTKSPRRLYDQFYNKIKMAHDKQKELKTMGELKDLQNILDVIYKATTTIEDTTKGKPMNIKNDIEQIIHLLSVNNKEKANQYVNALDLLVN